jgi:2OG-Fe(II) oxygenase superfamily
MNLPLQQQHISATAMLREQFEHATPFKHLLLDNFLLAPFVAELVAQFPAFDPKRARNENGDIGLKAVNEKIRGLGTAYAQLDDVLQSREWLNWVSDVTGIPDLLYDAHYFGGGTHDNKHGQDLDAHIDFNRHPLDNSHRRLNLIVYLNDGWQESWGGLLELHSDPRAANDQIKRINPIYNRLVIFETTESSWHAFNRIDLPENVRGQSRRSIAIYLYTKLRPALETGPTHSTIYVDSPLPDYLQDGHTLSADDVQTLKILIARRDQHNQRLYKDISSLTTQLEAAKHALGMSRARRLWWMVRRALGRK